MLDEKGRVIEEGKVAITYENTPESHETFNQAYP